MLVMTSAYARPRLQTLGEGEWSPKAARPGVGEENRLSSLRHISTYPYLRTLTELTTLTSMLWSIDSCQNKVSADQYHVPISQAHLWSSSRSHVFVKLTAEQMVF